MPVHLLEINDQALGRPHRHLEKAAHQWQLLARCSDASPDSCLLLQQLVFLGRQNRTDGRAALAALDKLIQVAAKGMPLETFYDKKQSHELHAFHYKGQRRVIWRLRKNDIRLAFYYAEGRVIFLADAFAKRQDKLTAAEKARLEEEVRIYIDAESAGQLQVLS